MMQRTNKQTNKQNGAFFCLEHSSKSAPKNFMFVLSVGKAEKLKPDEASSSDAGIPQADSPTIDSLIGNLTSGSENPSYSKSKKSEGKAFSLLDSLSSVLSPLMMK
jgi:hypothetical protein